MALLVAPPTLTFSRETIQRHAQSLPAAPQILAGLCELLENTNTNASEVAELIRVDQALAARVLRLSNSVVFRGATHISSIEEAVTRIGLVEMTRLVGTATVAGLFDRTLVIYRLTAERLRESLLLHALASEALARSAELDAREAYSGGLLRAMGMMVLDRIGRGKLAPAEYFDPKRHASYADWELARFGITGAELTALLLEEWRFPPGLVSALDQHATPADSAMGAVLNLGGAVVAAHGLALPGDVGHWVVEPGKLALARLDEVQLRTASECVRAAFERHRAALY